MTDQDTAEVEAAEEEVAEAEEQEKETGEEEEEAVEEEEDIKDPIVPIRGSAAHIIARQKDTIDKLRNKGDEGVEEEDDDDLAPESKDAVQREVQSQVEPIRKEVAAGADESELQGLFRDYPDAKKYENRIRGYMAAPGYESIPPLLIFNHLNADNAQAEGARKREIADAEAAQTAGGGSTTRPIAKAAKVPSIEEQENMTDEQLDEVKQKLLPKQ